jgi:hypothetical protein
LPRLGPSNGIDEEAMAELSGLDRGGNDRRDGFGLNPFRASRAIPTGAGAVRGIAE